MAKGNKKKEYKTSKDKAGKEKSVKPVVKKKYVDMYYMIPERVGAKEIADTLTQAEPAYAEILECWEEAGVLELLLGEESSIDFEMLELSEDELEEEFLQSHKIKGVYLVHTDSERIGDVKKVVTILKDKFGGLLCSDSKDFMPIILQ